MEYHSSCENEYVKWRGRNEKEWVRDSNGERERNEGEKSSDEMTGVTKVSTYISSLCTGISLYLYLSLLTFSSLYSEQMIVWTIKTDLIS